VRLRTTTALLLALVTGLTAGCGSDDEEGSPIPAQAASELQKRLDSVQGRFDFGGGACADIPEDQQLANQTIASLPSDVDPDVRSALQDGFDRLFQLTDEQCDEQKGQETETTPTPTETTPTPTETTPTETTPTETTPTQTEQQPPPETTPGDAQPPGQGGEPPGQGGQNPGQGGGGGTLVPEAGG
jgi:hypothetical protein